MTFPPSIAWTSLALALASASCFADTYGSTPADTEDGTGTDSASTTSGPATDTTTGTATSTTTASTSTTATDATTGETGSTGECVTGCVPGEFLWQVTDLGRSFVADMHTDPTGAVYLYGSAAAPVDVVDITIGGMENSDVFVVRMDEDGEFDWGVARGSANAEEYPTALHVNASGFIALSGFYAGVGDVGGGALPDSGTDFAGFVTNIDVATRQNLVTHSMTVAAGGSGVNIRGPVAMNAGDDTMVAGTFESTVTFSGADYTSEGESDILYARFDPAGDNPVVFSGAGADAVSGVVFSQGGVFVAGEFAVDIELTEVNEASDGLDAFLFRGDELLTSISWDMTTQSAGDERVVWFDADATGNVYVVGAYTEAIQWPGTQREDAVELDDIWLTKVSPTGTVQWLKSFGGLGNDMPRNLAVSDSGEVVIAGEFASTIEFGDTSHNLIGGDMDAFVAKFDTDGNVVWSHAGGGQGTDRALAVEFAPDGSVYAAYSFFADADFGGGVIVVAQNGSAIVKYAP